MEKIEFNTESCLQNLVPIYIHLKCCSCLVGGVTEQTFTEYPVFPMTEN